MLIIAFYSLACAALLGSALGILHMRSASGAAIPWPLAALHALLGLGGLGGLILALRGPPRGLAEGTAMFGTISAVLIIAAALLGCGIFLIHCLKARRAGTLMGLHATIAICGIAVLAAYLFAG
jgi:hypothetical protein